MQPTTVENRDAKAAELIASFSRLLHADYGFFYILERVYGAHSTYERFNPASRTDRRFLSIALRRHEGAYILRRVPNALRSGEDRCLAGRVVHRRAA